MGLVDVDDPFSGTGAFDRGGTEDDVDFPILDGSTLRLWDLGRSLPYLGLQGLSGIGDKFLKIARIH